VSASVWVGGRMRCMCVGWGVQLDSWLSSRRC
jgi:hypothetical protein